MDNNLAMLHLVRRREAGRRRRSLRLQRRQLRDASNAFELAEVRFMELFRLPQYWVLFLIETLTPFLGQTTRRTRVPFNLRVLAALNFYATGSYQRSVGEDYHVGLSQTMISRAINEVSLAIERHLMADWIKFPTTEAEKTVIKQRFMEKTGFPGVIGAIDCTHIAILAPSVDGHNYRNRKGFHSKNVQIIADYDLKILNVNARFAGSTHDSYIWRNSVIRQHMLELHDKGVRGSWLLGDSGYRLSGTLAHDSHNECCKRKSRREVLSMPRKDKSMCGTCERSVEVCIPLSGSRSNIAIFTTGRGHDHQCVCCIA